MFRSHLHNRFEQAILPHLDGAYNLARWLVRNDQDAEDLVQRACIRAYRAFQTFRGGDTRAWLLTIVRNACYTWLKRNRAEDLVVPFQEELHDVHSDAMDPEVLLLQRVDLDLLQRSLQELPAEYREVIVLRELEGLSYKEIAAIAEVPLGTVMSRLARARKRLQDRLADYRAKEVSREL